MNSEDEGLVDSFLSSGGFLTLVEEDEDGNFVEVKPSAGTDSADQAVASPVEKLPAGFICPFVPTSEGRISAFLETCLAGEQDNLVVFDLGSGDGRILHAIAKKVKCKCVGVEIDPELVKYAKSKAASMEIDDTTIDWRCQDVRDTDFSLASVVIVYLIPSALKQLNQFLHQEWQTHGFRLFTFVYKFEPGLWVHRELTGGEEGQETSAFPKCVNAEYSIFDYGRYSSAV
jgi:SAM-dependent methyltransferase